MATVFFVLSLLIVGSQGESHSTFGSWGKWWWALFEILFLTAACSNPKVESETYTTNDVLLSSENALIIEMELSCDDVSTMDYTYQCM